MRSGAGKAGEVSFNRGEKVNAELLLLTYGALVAQILKDNEKDAEATNKKLDKIGYSIGQRIIDDYLARNMQGTCKNFVETADAIAKGGFKMFLGISPEVRAWNADKTEFTLSFDENPLTDFVELPEDLVNKLWYSNIYCGVIRGALEMVMLKVECTFMKDALRGDNSTEIRVKLVEEMAEEYPFKDD
mmetsp:Transcript_26330/g.67061  ORF Transcript_26330/g.67061 Transcript_26330/m.67061 type:complete len:188 (+) Transcript_26330:79-642(+)|eukprot:CAMPEP_0113880652 /NCGR_PEP_ID=MMETSP0780_2-20120614/7910_1 /TAXON_ID=652834 /ORGANISM="Palpitomonas bilix" /LENGTH=187 /DNA_ID=CAMNT_0000867363 /DNA_START=96 /DNA_END=659 /DNA_ORIENTATION=- /assembly_acc=CAM_ASM_000599